MHNSSNDTSRLFQRETAFGTPREKWKVFLLPSFLFSVPLKDFFLRKGNNGEQAGRVDKAYDAASRRIRGTFAAPFCPTKLQRDFHKAQRRAENTLVIRWVARGRRRGAAKWKGNFAIHAVKTHGVSYLFPLLRRDSLRVSKSEKILATSSLRSILRSLCIVS